MPPELKTHLRKELTSPHHQTEGVSGLKVGVANTRASMICLSNKDCFLPGTCRVDEAKTKLGGIAGGLQICSRGKTSFEMITQTGKVQKIIRTTCHVPDIPINLFPPQGIMRNNTDGWFKTNGANTAFEFADGTTVDVGFDPVMRLPMIHMFDDADKAAEDLETALCTCMS